MGRYIYLLTFVVASSNAWHRIGWRIFSLLQAFDGRNVDNDSDSDDVQKGKSSRKKKLSLIFANRIKLMIHQKTKSQNDQ